MRNNPVAIAAIVLLCIGIPVVARAQKEYTNSISLVGTNYKFNKLASESYISEALFYDQVGIYYERKVTEKYEIAVGFSRWINFNHNDESWGVPATVSWDHYLNRPFGKIAYRQNYKMIDLFWKYRVSLNKRNEVKAGLGASYTFGSNVYLDSEATGPNFQVYTHTKTQGYFGVVPTLSYDHAFCNNRLAVGADLRYRKYFGLLSQQIDYGIHVSCNF